MIDIVHDAEKRLLNTISLNLLLDGSDVRFRKALIGALIREGFELDEPFPFLQHPKEILDAIHWMGSLDFGDTWESFKQALLAAGRIGILVDLSIRKKAPRPALVPFQPLPHALFKTHQLETA
jgi:hypothetical protein